jgi:hypothetical protein
MQLGDKVKITHIKDPGVSWLKPRVDQIGKISRVYGASGMGMFQVVFEDGFHDAFWGEELEVINNVSSV